MIKVIVLTIVTLIGGPNGGINVQHFEAPDQAMCENAAKTAYEMVVRKNPSLPVLDVQAHCDYYDLSTKTHA